MDRTNYEIAFIDYLDGNLSAEQEAELLLFLEKNPDLKEELDAIGEIEFQSEAIVYHDKSQLKKSPLEDDAMFEQACIASIENDLDSEAQKELDQFVSHQPERKKTLLLFGKTKFEPDNTVIFANKEILYKRIIGWWYHPQLISIAAALILAVILIGTLDRQFQFNNQFTARTLSYTIDPPQAEQPSYIIETPKDEFKTSHNNLISSSSSTIQKSKNTIQNTNTEQVRYDQDQVLNQMAIVSRSLPTHIYIYKPTLALNNYQSRDVNSASSLSRVNRVGRSLLTGNNGKMKNIPREDIQTGLFAAVNRLTNERVNFETDEKGKVKKLNLNGALLAFSIPLSRN